MKKAFYLFLLLVLLFPFKVLAYDQGTVNCYYKVDAQANVYFLHFTFMGLGIDGQARTVDIESYYYNKETNAKTTEFTIKDDGRDYIINSRADYNTYFSLDNHYFNIYDRVNNGESNLIENGNTKVCPTQVYKLKNGDNYQFFICNGYNSDVGVDTCSAAENYLNSENSWESYMKSTYNFTTSTAFNNVGQKDKTQTNINDTYNDLLTEQDDVCDENSENYDYLQCQETNDKIEDITDQAKEIDPTKNILYDKREEVGNASNVLIGNVSGMDICSQNGVKNVLHVIGYLIFAVKIAVPLLLVIMGSIDLAQALMASDDKAMKDAMSKLIKRVIAGIIVFFIPTILNFFLGLVDGVSDNQTNFTGCSSCLFTPFDGSCTYTKIGE